MRWNWVTTFAFFLYLPIAHAEPGPVEVWLMNQPVTLWDRGMDYMERHAKDLESTINKIDHVRVDYNPKVSYIELWVRADRIPFEKSRCARIIQKVRRHGNVREGGARYKSSGSWYSAGFKHFNYGKKTRPKSVQQKIDEIIQITVAMKGGRCEGKLLSFDVKYETNQN